MTGFRVHGSRQRVWRLGFQVKGLKLRIQRFLGVRM
jgi:hypothetical protein